MTKKNRLIVALAIVLSGLALTPFISLPARAFNWQQFAGAYQDLYTLFLPFISR